MKIPILRIPFDENDIAFIKDGVEKVLRSGYLTMSERVCEFESMYAGLCGTKYAVATNTGTSAIEMALRAIGVEGYTVIVPSNTYMATAIAAINAGARVIFAECQKENLQIDPEDVERKIQPNTRGIIVVHIGGYITPHLERLKEICRRRNLFLIEDAAHAHGATIDGRAAGSLSLAGAFSFYPTKVMTTAEGGMCVTNDANIYEKSLVLREHGKTDHDYNLHEEFGGSWGLSELHAVLGLQQIKKIDWILAERRRVAALYNEFLRAIDEVRPVTLPTNICPSYYKYIVYLDERIGRASLKKAMREKYQVVLPGEVYSDPCHSQPVFKKYPEKMANQKGDKFPITDYVCRYHLCLPLYPGLKEEEIRHVISSLKEAIVKMERV